MCEGCEERIHVGHQVHRIDRSISKLLEMRVKEEGLDEIALMHGWILRYLYEHQDKEIYQKDIEKYFGICRSAVTNIIQTLEKKGYICRASVANDARLKKVMLTEKGPKVLEYNARFGDPEAQVVIPRLKNDIVEVFEACVDGKLDEVDLQFEDNAAVCVVLASDGYPVSYEKGFPIEGLDTFKDKDGYYVFHAGTAFKDGKIVTNGGRVLGVTAKGADLKEARANAYKATQWIQFENKYMRNDIGKAIDEA